MAWLVVDFRLQDAHVDQDTDIPAYIWVGTRDYISNVTGTRPTTQFGTPVEKPMLEITRLYSNVPGYENLWRRR